MASSTLSQVTFEFPNELCRLEGPASVQVGAKIYVDGGGATAQRCSEGSCAQWLDNNNYLWELSLDNEFTSQNLPVTGFLKPESVPDTSGAVLWRNKAGTELYLFGGAYNLVQNLTTPNFQNPAWPTIWGYDISTNTWFNGSTGGTNSFLPTSFAAYASAPDLDLGFSLGGNIGDDTVPNSTVKDWRSYGGFPQLGLMAFGTNSSTQNFPENQTSATSLPFQGAVARGNIVYTRFGKKGSLVLLGGAFINLNGTVYWPALFNTVYVFDIDSNTWFYQLTSADAHMPNPRHYACASVAFNDKSDTAEIILLGGDPDCAVVGANCDSALTFSRGIDILTLPAFRWFHFEDSTYSPNSSMSGAGCHVVGSNLVRIGGWNSWLEGRPAQSCAPLANVLDLTSLTWTDHFDPSASEYVAPPAVQAWNAAHKSPVGGWVQGLEGVFAQPRIGNSTTTVPSSAPVTPPSLNHTGAIVGGVIGGLALVALCLIGVLLYRRKRSSRHRAELDQAAQGAERRLAWAISELPDDPKPHELPSGSKPIRHELAGG